MKPPQRSLDLIELSAALIGSHRAEFFVGWEVLTQQIGAEHCDVDVF